MAGPTQYCSGTATEVTANSGQAALTPRAQLVQPPSPLTTPAQRMSGERDSCLPSRDRPCPPPGRDPQPTREELVSSARTHNSGGAVSPARGSGGVLPAPHP